MLAIGELHGQATLHLGNVFPLDGNLVLVDGSLEGCHGLRLWHTRHFCDVAIGIRMVDDQQVAVANGVGAIFCLTFAMTIGRVTGNTRVTHPGRSQTFAGSLFKGVEMFEEVLARIEVLLHACYILHSRSGSRVAGLLCRSELSTREPLVSGEYVVGLAKHFLRRNESTKFLLGFVIVGTGCE